FNTGSFYHLSSPYARCPSASGYGGIAFSSAGLGMSMAGLGVGIGSGILWGGALALGTYIGHQLDERYVISDWIAGY
ncbi:MAG: hypothetical protein COS89_08920, partial [Deltaproteobacteria bacterium CG07_land_8_20_14_0_80_38_7]